jgi:precorrin-6B methylase 1
MMADLFGDNDVDIDIHDSDSNDFVSNVRNESNVSPQVSEFLSIPNSQGKITASMVNDNLNTHTLNIMEYLTTQEERRREEREARMKRESEEKAARSEKRI